MRMLSCVSRGTLGCFLFGEWPAVVSLFHLAVYMPYGFGRVFNFLCDLCSCHVETSIEASGCVLMDTARKERLLYRNRCNKIRG